MSDLTITLEGSEVRADFFGTNAWLRNDGAGTIYAGRKPGVVSGADGVVSVPAGGSAPVYDAHGTVYLIGTGSVQLIGSDYSENPFKSSAQGGSGADEVARAAIEAHAGNSAIHLTAEQINGVDGGKTVEKSASYTLDNAVDYPIVDMRIYGKSTQDGVPTPDAPVDIVSVGDSGTVGVTACGKNLFDLSLVPDNTVNGVTFTKNGNGSFTVSGGKTEDISFTLTRITLSHEQSLKIFNSPGDYILSGVPYCEGRLEFIVNWFSNGNMTSGYLSSWEEGANLKNIPESRFSDDFYVVIAIYITNGYDVLTGTFFPQIEKGSTATAYEPYIGSTASLTSALPLCGIPVDADGNYTDSNGQQWICDELIYNANGTGKVVKNTMSMLLDGSDDEEYVKGNTTEIYETFGVIKSLENNLPIKYTENMMCNNTAIMSGFKTTVNDFALHCGNNLNITFGLNMGITTVEAVKTWLSAHPTTIIYPLKTPQEISLTAEEMSQLQSLQTFDGITNISNDSGAEMCVKYCTNSALSEYEKPVIDGLKKQINELKTAVLSLGGNV